MPARRPPLLREFGSRVRDRRHELGLSQEEVGGIVSRHRTYIGMVERGDRNPTLANVLRIAAALEVDPADLVRGLTAD